MGIVTPQQLDGYLGKPIGEICRNGYDNDADNHGAHFVSHAMSYGFGTTCIAMRRRGKYPGATLWIHEIFSRCPTVGAWTTRAATLTSCLVFITRPDNVNVTTKTMANLPTKHVGIHVSGLIWHYSNSQRTVVRQTPDQFSHHFLPPDNAMFYGSLP